MPKLTYRAQAPDDPTFTQVGSHRFEHGKAVEVDDATYERLSKNPWFKGGKAAREQAEDAASAGAGEGLNRDSAINLAPPPGSGSKYPGYELVATGDGLVPAEEASDVDGANVAEGEGDDAPKRRGRPPKDR